MNVLKIIQKLTLVTLLVLALGACSNKDTNDTNTTGETTGTTQDVGEDGGANVGGTDMTSDSANDDVTTDNNTSTETNETNTPIVTSLKLIASDNTIIRTKDPLSRKYAVVHVPLKVEAHYSDGKKEELTDRVQWSSIPESKAKIYEGEDVLSVFAKGEIALYAQYGTIKSNTVTIISKNIEDTQRYLEKRIYNTNALAFLGRGAGVEIALVKRPYLDVTLPLRLEENTSLSFKSTGTTHMRLDFKATKRWDIPKVVEVVDASVGKNLTQPYKIYTDAFESNDSYYEGVNPEDIEIVPHQTIKIDPPSLRQRRGAIRGVRIAMLLFAHNGHVSFSLIDPPKGLRIVPAPLHSVDEYEELSKSAVALQWDVPMDAIEGKAYAITVEATEKNHNPEYQPKKGRVTFDVKVPKTTAIQTKLENNELTVTDKNSPLYGMKMKGHNGEDISQVRLRAVGYGDVWRKRVEPTNSDDKVEHIVFVIDNMPEALDVKMPEWMDTYKERINIGMHSYKYKYDETVVLINNYWGRASNKGYFYDNTNGYVYLHKMNGSEIFLISLEEAQNKGKF